MYDRGVLWLNEAESSEVNGEDTDGNGFVDDRYGWDFADNDRVVFDWPQELPGGQIGTIPRASHGQGMIQILVDMLPTSTSIRIQPVRIIAGGNGPKGDRLEKALDYVDAAGPAVVLLAVGGPWDTTSSSALRANAVRNSERLYVLAAGNDGVEISAGSFLAVVCTESNIICVASSTDGVSLGSAHVDSNYSSEFIDLAAFGGPVLLNALATTPIPPDLNAPNTILEERFLSDLESGPQTQSDHLKPWLTCLVSQNLNPQNEEDILATWCPSDPEGPSLPFEGTSVAAACTAANFARTIEATGGLPAWSQATTRIVGTLTDYVREGRYLVDNDNSLCYTN